MSVALWRFNAHARAGASLWLSLTHTKTRNKELIKAQPAGSARPFLSLSLSKTGWNPHFVSVNWVLDLWKSKRKGKDRRSATTLTYLRINKRKTKRFDPQFCERDRWFPDYSHTFTLTTDNTKKQELGRECWECVGKRIWDSCPCHRFLFLCLGHPQKNRKWWPSNKEMKRWPLFCARSAFLFLISQDAINLCLADEEKKKTEKCRNGPTHSFSPLWRPRERENECGPFLPFFSLLGPHEVYSFMN